MAKLEDQFTSAMTRARLGTAACAAMAITPPHPDTDLNTSARKIDAYLVSRPLDQMNGARCWELLGLSCEESDAKPEHSLQNGLNKIFSQI